MSSRIKIWNEKKGDKWDNEYKVINAKTHDLDNDLGRAMPEQGFKESNAMRAWEVNSAHLVEII